LGRERGGFHGNYSSFILYLIRDRLDDLKLYFKSIQNLKVRDISSSYKTPEFGDKLAITLVKLTEKD
jgi:hypothetical protein